MAEKLIFEKKIDGINVVLQVEDREYSVEEEMALWGDLVRAVSSVID